MPSLTFVVVSMGRLAHVQQTLGSIVSQRESRCVVVDYSCPDKTGDWVEANYPQVKVIRMPGHQLFDPSHARNAGAALAETPSICFVDADVIVDPTFADVVIPKLGPGRGCRPSPFYGVGGMFVCPRDEFVLAGGYDESIKNYGDDDFDLFDALNFQGVTWDQYPSALRKGIHHGHDVRLRNFPCKDIRQGQAINRNYRVLKWLIAHDRNKVLERKETDALYARLQMEVPDYIDRKGLKGQSPWSWRPFEPFIAEEFRLAQGKELDAKQRAQMRAAFEMKIA